MVCRTTKTKTMKQTAVEWLFENTNKLLMDLLQGNITTISYGIKATELIYQAKQMEKEQLIDAHIEGQRVFDEHPHTQWTTDQAEQYYNETYGK